MSVARPKLIRSAAGACMLLALLLRLVLPGLHTHRHGHHQDHGHGLDRSAAAAQGDGPSAPHELAPAIAADPCLACTFDDAAPTAPPPLPAPARVQRHPTLPRPATTAVLLLPRYRAHPSRAPPLPSRRVERLPA
ncbi:MAG: hypothetical protein IT455_10100 [Planctomycetes bacterium]|nr:hypothetical protein [Planctomycetota bacterium]